MPRYGPRSSRSRRKQSRTLPVKGSGEDSGRYFRCWNCGFTCRADRDQLGDEESRSGVVVEEFVVSNELGYQFGDDPLDAEITLDAVGSHFEVLPRASSSGDNWNVRHDQEGVASSGCPMCGTLNWRGNHP